ncbi:MAG: hypothetical protein OHK0015_36480 [Chloroflexi bacterium OHK40]
MAGKAISKTRLSSITAKTARLVSANTSHGERWRTVAEIINNPFQGRLGQRGDATLPAASRAHAGVARLPACRPTGRRRGRSKPARAGFAGR